MNATKFTKVLSGVCAAWLAWVCPADAQPAVSIVNVNNQTTVTWRGQQVFSGPTKGPVCGQVVSVGREEYAAAFDGKGILWENVPGAAKKIQSATTTAANLDQQSRARGKVPPARPKRPVSTGVWASTTDGQTTILWNGKQVYAGPTKAPVTARSQTVDGVECTAVFEGQTVLWENAKDAAKRLK